MMLIGLALLLQATAPELPPLHGGPAPMTCPVGGERFSAWQPSVYSTYGERPDGRPYSYLPFPFPLPECPGNKLIVIGTYTPAEVERLERIVVSPNYRALTTAETSYYRGYWLATQLGRPAGEALSLLLQATWQTTPGSGEESDAATRVQSARYQAEFAVRVAEQRERLTAIERPRYEARAANALRQLGRFAEADALWTRANDDLDEEARAKGWATYLAKLRPVIARHDASVEPLDMIPEQEAARHCIDVAAPDAFTRAFCARPAIAAQAAEWRAARDRVER